MIPPAKRSVLITGCSAGGIGEALALEYHVKGGYRVFATSRTLASMKSLAGHGIETLALDVTVPENIQQVKEEISKRTGGKLHVLVNNAGIGETPRPLTDLDIKIVRKIFETNVFGVIQVTHEFLPLLLAAKGSTLVNISSLAAVIPLPFQSAYAATKGALNAFGDAIRIELAPFGVKVVTVLPGIVQTNIANARPSSFLSETSLYKPIEADYERLSLQGYKRGTKVTDYAKTLVSELTISNPKPQIWGGAQANLAWFAFKLFPWWLLDKISSDRLAISKMNDFIARGVVKVPVPS